MAKKYYVITDDGPPLNFSNLPEAEQAYKILTNNPKLVHVDLWRVGDDGREQCLRMYKRP
jgi:hypothetical protein